jgi:protein involved in polysaccharide export with SLBB domain
MRLRGTRLTLVLIGVALSLIAGGCASRHVSEREVVEGASLRPDVPAYRLRVGDRLRVSFPTALELSYATPVTPSGTVSVPMSGEVTAAGKTVAELSRTIEEHMSDYLVDPTVSVSIETVTEQWVYVIGEVNRPGRYEVDAGMSVTGALAQAGGIRSSGKRSSIMVVRTAGLPEPTAFKVNVDKVFSGVDLSENALVVGNDVVYVPKSVIGQVDEFVDLFVTKIMPAELFYLHGYEIAKRTNLNLWD